MRQGGVSDDSTGLNKYGRRNGAENADGGGRVDSSLQDACAPQVQ